MRYSTTTKTADPCIRTCPACGGLECLCRPRFFAGQLLTEQDLNLLDHYIVAKNKLHNRYLHGWGVVCGMEVVCSPCDNLVTVKPGYALSPCGNDIVVCSPASVDVCAMIAKCRPRRRDDCFEPPQAGRDPCLEGDENWVLCICYEEKPSRGITALAGGGAACCSRCSCGGSSACGCRCHTHEHTAHKQSSAKRNPPQCEPTVTCEGYTFKVCKEQPETTRDRGELIERARCCGRAIEGIITQPPTDPAQVQQWCCKLRDSLLDFFAHHPGYDCGLPQRLAALCTPGVPVATILNEVGLIVGQYYYYCFCSTLLPPCPDPVDDDCVPIATVTVRRRDCRILHICNFGVHKFATTFPALQYWLSSLPYMRDIRKALETLCCTPQQLQDVKLGEGRTPLSAAAPAQPDQTRVLSMLALSAWAQKERIVNPQILGLAVLGLTDKQGRPFLSQLEVDHLFETVLLNDVGLPLVQDLIPPAGTAGGRAAGADPLREQLNRLQETVDRQQRTIDELIDRLGNQ
jgi:hypothetical protein